MDASKRAAPQVTTGRMDVPLVPAANTKVVQVKAAATAVLAGSTNLAQDPPAVRAALLATLALAAELATLHAPLEHTRAVAARHVHLALAANTKAASVRGAATVVLAGSTKEAQDPLAARAAPLVTLAVAAELATLHVLLGSIQLLGTPPAVAVL